MQLLLALLATAAVAVACLPTQDHRRSKAAKEDNDPKRINATRSQAVYPDEVITTQATVATNKPTSSKLRDAETNPNQLSSKTVQSGGPKRTMGYRMSGVPGPNYVVRNKPKYPATVKPTTTTTTTTERSMDYYADYPNDYDSTHSKFTYDKPPALCPGDGFMCQRDCERRGFHSGYCKDSHCVCFGKFS